MNEPNTHQAHNLTHEEISLLHQQQKDNAVKTLKGNNCNNIKDEIFKELYSDYRFQAAEQEMYHIAFEIRGYSQTTGVKFTNPSVKVFHKKAYEFQKEHGGFNGAVTHILHNPSKLK